MKTPSSLTNPTIETLVAVAGGLLIVIISLASSLLKAARRLRAGEKEQEGKNALQGTDAATISASSQVKTAGGPLAGAATAAGQVVSGVSDTAFYLVSSVIIAEAVVILYLLFNLNRLARQEGPAASRHWSFAKWWAKVNRFRPIGQEADLDLGHDYDGIRELNNRLPPWWLYGFYLTIVFAGVYLWRYHVAHSAPLPAEEYQIAVREAEVRKAAFLKATANNVDENTVKLLTDKSDLDAGKAIFQGVCFACHGMNGEGGVGPNLTDKYWLHGGSVGDVFKTIKYGWPDKGMKSWKDDYSPQQIAQLASYVKSLSGTNPPNAKAPQGTLEN
ncbi:MAG TPA: cbb3-type cytochrome c oxidase N-terminal domain-containing protein [Puia sp.]|nr:cbb3-type cytochrome c oxidase N-terminal domain-containing protein [Puia sp.]